MQCQTMRAPAGAPVVPICTYGVDVSKDSLVIASSTGTAVRCVANTGRAINAWLKDLAPASRIALESTGAFHLLLAQRAHQAGMTVYILNARDVYHYARALGTRGKTDRVDARLIARYCASEHARLHPWVPPSPRQALIQALVRRRAQVLQQRTRLLAAFAPSQAAPDLRLLHGPLQAAAQQRAALAQAIDQALARAVAGEAALAAHCARLQTVSGIGTYSATFLGNLFTQIPFANADALIAYSGLDPRPKDSGKAIGRRKLSKRGSAPMRRLLFACAMAAATSKAFKPLYLSLKARGFAGTQALIILARKLLRVCFAVFRSEKPFEPARFDILRA